MDLRIIFVTSTSAVVEISDGGKYFTTEPCSIRINGNEYGVTDRVVTGIYDLEPDTEYVLAVSQGEKEQRITFRTQKESYCLNVRDFGAKGDGASDDTSFVQAAIAACPTDGRVLVPRGRYKVSSIFLKSNLVIELGEGAVLSGLTERERRPLMPGLVRSHDGSREYNLGTWEGEPLTMFAAVIHGIRVENVVIFGRGTIDGNAGNGDWWKDPKEKRIAWRPRLVFLDHCKNITLEGIKATNSPSWTIHPYFSEGLRFINLSIVNPEDSPNTDAIDPESCTNVEITGVHFDVGDDCIAVKSGKLYMGSTYKVPSQDIVIRQCCMRHGHGSVTVGSEVAGGIKKVTVRDCLFIGTDRGLRIKSRRGRGKDAIVDEILFDNIRMEGVLTPIVINCFYNCDPDGHTEYVGTKETLPVDHRTPEIGRIVFRNLECVDCHVAAAYIYGLPEKKIDTVEMEAITFSFLENAREGVPAMMDDLDSGRKMGVYVNNVTNLVLRSVRVIGQDGEAVVLENVDNVVKEE